MVDVPGHEGLVRTMVAGATGIDAVLFCVSAVDGVMPQTVEHLAILQLLLPQSHCCVAAIQEAALCTISLRDCQCHLV